VSATAQARTLVSELIAAGVTDLVIAPGSRNGPISLAALAAPGLTVTVRIDERSAAFTALGLAKVTKRKTAVVVTSGTAGAHLLPALIEAAQSDVELIAITADRPKDLVNTGANQTIEQLELFLAATKNVVDLDSAWPAEMWCNEIQLALKQSGVIHLNPRFNEPLLPTDPWQGPTAAPAINSRKMERFVAAHLLNGKRGVVICSGDEIEHAGEIAQKLNWPLIAEPVGTLHPNLIPSGALVAAKFTDQIEVVLTVGRAGLARGINSLINTKPRIAVKVPTALTNVTAVAQSNGELDLDSLSAIGHDWLNNWHDQASTLRTEIDKIVSSGALGGLNVADTLLTNLKSQNLLHAAASLSLRDLDYLMKPNSIGLLTANRGVNGIDGIVASAIGASIAWQRTGGGQAYCLLGDVALLHDLASLTIPKTEFMPNLRLVVVDNNGGGVFSTIEQRGVAGFERVFGTPHQVNIAELLRGFGIEVTEVNSTSQLASLVKDAPGLSAVVISGVDREIEANLRKEIVNLTR
jgi:2-succinyl-5-enolpyruvyl-6-hydroxy-3-cyclohexene-1-carboxylate synthase